MAQSELRTSGSSVKLLFATTKGLKIPFTAYVYSTHFINNTSWPGGIPVLGIEPAANVAAAAHQRGIPTLVRFFGEGLAKQLVAHGTQADLVVGNNVLAHVPRLNDFVRGLKILLKPHGVLTLEFPHLLRLLAEKQFDTIYHEHFSYFSLGTVHAVLAAHGLSLFDVEEWPTHGGSLRIYAQHSEAPAHPVMLRVAELLEREEAAGLHCVDTYGDLCGGGQSDQTPVPGLFRARERAPETACRLRGPGEGQHPAQLPGDTHRFSRRARSTAAPTNRQTLSRARISPSCLPR